VEKTRRCKVEVHKGLRKEINSCRSGRGKTVQIITRGWRENGTVGTGRARNLVVARTGMGEKGKRARGSGLFTSEGEGIVEWGAKLAQLGGDGGFNKRGTIVSCVPTPSSLRLG